MKMKIIDDKFEWIDKTFLLRTYKVKDVRDTYKSDGMVKFEVPTNFLNEKSKKMKMN